MNIENGTFLVTGGASGLGLATAQMLVDNGANVVLLDVNIDAGLAAERQLGTKAKFIQTDVSNEAQVSEAIEWAVSNHGSISGVANCAGIGPAMRVVGKNGPHALDLFAKVINVNLVGTFNVIRLASASMQNNEPNEFGERGVIINTASVAAYDGQIGQAAYSASKGGIVAMTLPIARELARVGIRVMTIAPGIFETPLLMGMSEEVKNSLGQQVPFPPRLGKPSEYASLAKHIFENVMLNGEIIRLDGAIRMAAK
ncbi:short-chain dehydrogenase/reductase SDR [Emticicia oligotrophica DSM 17448]|uniref:Short-chain dehydrogenase/reductase SDR n=1 Tax=Emticicia oligotrophica (strain DSM 17448 / CIP 109782 / MTCC 6937 / GPTSA100-15) TaxID=929562 RepID=A0ABN4AS95_EMTOG|nr:3-hydroxyacyl-CoA dehydrogenase [Emticicia oligotrophica]AFK05015.1 short-chain dehydrogenase/reductase SDR [Emticicia oligotrophica DSM 17448]